MTRNTLIGIGVAAAILILVIIWLIVGRQAQYGPQVSPTPTTLFSPTPTATTTVTPTTTQTATPGATTVKISITSTGFSPATAEILKGGTAAWVNGDSIAHQVASTPHPVHTDYPPLNSVGTLQPGESGSLTFPASGTYRYHDHLSPSTRGTVVVAP